MLNEAKTLRPRPRPRPKIIMKKYQIMINNIWFKIITGKINKILEFYTIFARKMPDYIIRQRDQGQAEAKTSRPRLTAINLQIVLTQNRLSIRCGHPVTVKLLLCARKTGNMPLALSYDRVIQLSYYDSLWFWFGASELANGMRIHYAGTLSSVKLSAFATTEQRLPLPGKIIKLMPPEVRF